MNKLENQKIYLKDYQVPNYLVDQVELTFKLSEEKTHVLAKIFFRANPEATDSKFYLDGIDLDLQWAKIDGERIYPTISSTGLSFNVNKKEFVCASDAFFPFTDNIKLLLKEKKSTTTTTTTN